MDLKEIRENIDAIDKEISKKIGERMDMAASIAAYKKEHGKSVQDGLREREVLKNVSQAAGENHGRYVQIIYHSVMDASKAHQYSILGTDSESVKDIQAAIENAPDIFPEEAVVACQGIPGAYSEAAANKMFRSPDIMYFNSFDKVFEAVEKGLCRYGVLPIENSNYGSIGAIYDLMRDHNFYIVRSTKHLVNHKLLAKKGTKLEDIKEIISHEQALGQCRSFLEKLDGVALSSTDNTATAAKTVAESERMDVAAISSAECADLYGLEIIADDIQISDHNFTRFICISKDIEIYPGDNKVSFMLKVEHKPMSLYHTMGKISTLGINICKLESRPIPGSDFDFLFYFDLDATARSEKVQQVIGELENQLDFFVFLGAYQEV